MDNTTAIDRTTPGPDPAIPAPEPQTDGDTVAGVSRRATLSIAALLATFMTCLVFGITAMDVPASAKWPGPRFFPTIIVVAGYTVSALLIIQALTSRRKGPAAAPEDDAPPSTSSISPQWRSLVSAIATFAVFAALLEPAGWLVAGTFLFWGIAVSLGSRRFLFDVAVAAVVASSVQLAFSAGLGLHLPVGLLGVF